MNYELLRPDELRDEQAKKALVFLPLGPLEWHGPHLPIGTDGLIARAVAERLSGALGGAVLPTLYAGGAAVLDGKTRDALGLPSDGAPVTGMDFAPGCLPSVYLKEQTLEAMLRDYVDALFQQGYRLVVLISGHGGAGHTPVLHRVCARTSKGQKAVWYPALLPLTADDPNSGHATLMETAVQLALFPDRVRLERLPPTGQPIPCAQYGMADDRYFRGAPAESRAVCADPRTATRELGLTYLSETVAALAARIQGELSALGGAANEV